MIKTYVPLISAEKHRRDIGVSGLTVVAEGKEEQLVVVPVAQAGDQVISEVDGREREPAQRKNADDGRYHSNIWRWRDTKRRQ